MTLAIDNVFSGYGGTDVLRDVTFAVSPGECVGVLGPNGAGKSTLLKVLSGQLKVRKGERQLDGHDVNSWSPHEAARRGVRWVGEPRPIYPGLTVEENLYVGGVTMRAIIAEQLELVFQLLPALREKRSSRAGRLSGGQQQMLAIGQALMSRPRYLCLDEPSLGLAPVMVAAVAELVSELVAGGVGVVWAEQFPELTRSQSTELVVLGGGSIVAAGPPDRITEAELERAYLGATRA